MIKFISGILVGFFAIPAALADPDGTFDIIHGLITKLSELSGVIGGTLV